jgi:hypothetical protein
MNAEPRRIIFRLHRDHLYLHAAAYAAQMADFRTVALLRKHDDLHIMPLIGADAGGYLIKQINARGDRAIHAADFFRLNGVDDAREIYCEGEWSPAAGSFVLLRLFASLSPT